MDPGLEDGHPEREAQGCVDHRAPEAETVGGNETSQDHRGETERLPMDLRRVEDGDHEHRRNVVDDGQCGQEDRQPQRDAVTEERQHPEGEGDVGRHRDAPAVCPRPFPD